jgi:hypothetical protein
MPSEGKGEKKKKKKKNKERKRKEKKGSNRAAAATLQSCLFERSTFSAVFCISFVGQIALESRLAYHMLQPFGLQEAAQQIKRRKKAKCKNLRIKNATEALVKGKGKIENRRVDLILGSTVPSLQCIFLVHSASIPALQISFSPLLVLAASTSYNMLFPASVLWTFFIRG